MALPDAAEPRMWHIRKQGMKTARCPKIITNRNLKVTGENSSTGGGMSRRKTLGELWLKGPDAHRHGEALPLLPFSGAQSKSRNKAKKL